MRIFVFDTVDVKIKWDFYHPNFGQQPAEKNKITRNDKIKRKKKKSDVIYRIESPHRERH